jgi:hypothetical protein
MGKQLLTSCDLTTKHVLFIRRSITLSPPVYYLMAASKENRRYYFQFSPIIQHMPLNRLYYSKQRTFHAY